MGTFPAYGMAGIGIAAAIGFVFALSFLSNNAIIDTDLIERQSSSEPSSLLTQQKVGNSEGMGENGSLLSDGQDTTAKKKAADQAPTMEKNTSLMMEAKPQAGLRPTLISIIASDSASGEMIGEVAPEMQLEAGKPVFIKANFVNQNDAQITSHLISLGVSSHNEDDTLPEQRQSYEQAATFHGDIGINGTVELELYWNPDKTGEYTLLLFSITHDELASAEPIRPIASIPIKVID